MQPDRTNSISVVIPTYNAAPFIGATLESVLAQSRLPDEVIVVDDCSTDQTVEIVQRIAKSAPTRVHVTVMAANSGGPAMPTNVGIEMSKGEMIALLDHDDWMLRGKLDCQAQQLQTHQDVGFVFSDFECLVGSEVRRGMTDLDYSILQANASVEDGAWLLSSRQMVQLQVAYPHLVQSCSNLMFRKSVWAEVGGFDRAAGPITDHKFKLAAATRFPACFLPRVLFRKRMHESNLFTKSYSPQLMHEIAVVGINALRSSGFTEWENTTIAAATRDGLFDGIYACRNARQYRASMWFAWQCFRLFGLQRGLVVRLCKWPFAVARNLLRVHSPAASWGVPAS